MTAPAEVAPQVAAPERPARSRLFLRWFLDALLAWMAGLALLLPVVVAGIVQEGRTMFVFPDTTVSSWVVTTLATCVTGVVAWRRLRRARLKETPLLPAWAAPEAGWWKGLLAACAAVGVAQLAMALALHVFNAGPSADPLMAAFPRAGSGALWPAIILIVLVGPVSEELLYRGLLVGRFVAYGYPFAGMALSGATFMLAHGDWRRFPFYFAFGVVLAWLYRRTRSLWPPLAFTC